MIPAAAMTSFQVGANHSRTDSVVAVAAAAAVASGLESHLLDIVPFPAAVLGDQQLQ